MSAQSTKAGQPGSRKLRFAERLRELREARGFSAARHFAAALGIRENRYTRYERGASEPDIELIYDFCDKLGVAPNELFGVGEAAPGAAPTGTPGFASGPQAMLTGVPTSYAGDERRHDERGSDQRRRESGDIARLRGGAGGLEEATAQDDAGMRAGADGAAWQLATVIVRQREAALPAQPAMRQPLARLAETARLYQALRASPYETVARLLTEPDIVQLAPTVGAEVEAAIARLMAALEHGQSVR